jgi:hypothetical protein
MTQYARKGWMVVSAAPNFLNVAMPDFSVQYAVSSFYDGDRPIFIGQIPSNSDYWALTVYDPDGLPVGGVNDSSISDQNYNIQLEYPIIPKDFRGEYCVIMRIYYRHRGVEVCNLSLPIIKIDEEILPIHKWTDIVRETDKIQAQLWSLFSCRFIQRLLVRGFYKPSQTDLVSLFPNRDAAYLVAFPYESRVLRIRWKPPVVSRCDVRFTGFMTCDLSDTRTFDSFSWRSKSSAIVILFIGYNRQEAIQKGMSSSDIFLQWEETVKYPCVVYREVRMKNKGVRSIPTNHNTAAQAQDHLKSFYPIITYM